MNTNEYLDLVQAKYGLKSDFSLSKSLGISRAAISNFRHGRSILSTEVSIKVAVLLNLHPAVVLADTCAERAKDDEERAIWLEIAGRFSPAGFAPVLPTRVKLSA